MRKEGHCEAAVFLFCVLVQNGRVSLEKRGNLACPAGAQEGRHLRFPPSCESPLSLGGADADYRHVTAAKRGTAVGLPQRVFLRLFAVHRQRTATHMGNSTQGAA